MKEEILQPMTETWRFLRAYSEQSYTDQLEKLEEKYKFLGTELTKTKSQRLRKSQ